MFVLRNAFLLVPLYSALNKSAKFVLMVLGTGSVRKPLCRELRVLSL